MFTPVNLVKRVIPAAAASAGRRAVASASGVRGGRIVGLHTRVVPLQQQQSEVQDGTTRHATVNVDAEEGSNSSHDAPAQQGGGEEHEAGKASGKRAGRHGGGARRGGPVARRADMFDIEREFGSLQNTVNQLFHDFDRNFGGSLLGGRMGGGGGGGLLSGFMPRFPSMMGGPSMFGMPNLLGGGGQQQQALLGDSSASDDALALPDPDTALDLMRTGGAAAMKIDVEEDSEKYRVTAEVPGFKQQDLKVRVDGDVLTIEGTHREEKKREDKQHRFLRSERTVRSVRRQLRLPVDAEHAPSSVKANYADGLLKIEVQKLPADKLKGHVAIASQSSSSGEKQPEPRLEDSAQEAKPSNADAQEVSRRMM